jgi:hypothetical protein
MNNSGIKTILKTGQDKLNSSVRNTETARTKQESGQHGFVRGAAYYGRKEK